jgi:hypothetical protein
MNGETVDRRELDSNQTRGLVAAVTDAPFAARALPVKDEPSQ